jgi:hypothetical protein
MTGVPLSLQSPPPWVGHQRGEKPPSNEAADDGENRNQQPSLARLERHDATIHRTMATPYIGSQETRGIGLYIMSQPMSEQ